MQDQPSTASQADHDVGGPNEERGERRTATNGWTSSGKIFHAKEEKKRRDKLLSLKVLVAEAYREMDRCDKSLRADAIKLYQARFDLEDERGRISCRKNRIRKALATSLKSTRPQDYESYLTWRAKADAREQMEFLREKLGKDVLLSRRNQDGELLDEEYKALEEKGKLVSMELSKVLEDLQRQGGLKDDYLTVKDLDTHHEGEQGYNTENRGESHSDSLNLDDSFAKYSGGPEEDTIFSTLYPLSEDYIPGGPAESQEGGNAA